MQINSKELKEVWGDGVLWLTDKADSYDLRYEYLDDVSLAELSASKLNKSGEHRLAEWESGWKENLEMLESGGMNALKPLYYGKGDILRWRQRFIKPASRNFEYNMHALIQYFVFQKYFKDVSSVYEFGCGTGHNLFRVRELYPEVKLYGLDWTENSQKIIKRINEMSLINNIESRKFDFFNPDYGFSLNENSGVYTSGALEQVGEKFDQFVDYLLVNKPRVCINLEIINELLNENNHLDGISLLYSKKRNYLNGFLTRLKKLEAEGKIIIHEARRLFIGTLFVESPSLVVWSPIA